MDSKRVINIAKFIFKLAFSALLIYLVFRKIDFQQLKSLFLRSNPLYLFVAFCFYFCSQLVSSWRLLGYLKSVGITLNFRTNFRLYLVGMFYNNFLPGGVGGDGYKIILLRKKTQYPVKKIFSALFFDRLSGLWAICFLASLLVFLVPGTEGWDWLPLIVVLTGTSVYYLIVNFYFKTFSAYWIPGHLKAIVVQGLQLISVLCILFSQHLTGDFSAYLFVFLLSTIATVAPISIGGLGIREFVMIKSTAFFAIDGVIAVYMTLSFYVISLICSLPGVFAWEVKEKEKPGAKSNQLQV